jgi:microsomal prostaglandin-E synthase 2
MKGELKSLNLSKDHKKVPIAKVNDIIITESSDIIKNITKNYAKIQLDKKNTNFDLFFPEDTQKWSDWSEKELAIMLYPNITRNLKESFDCFSYVDNVDTWSKPQQIVVKYIGSGFMSLANGKIKKKYNIVDERLELIDLLKVWTNSISGKKYLHGDIITMPDLMVFGVLKSICTTITFKEIMENIELKDWYNRVDNALKIYEVKNN